MNGKMAPEIAAEYIRRLRARGVLADAAHAALLAGHDLTGTAHRAARRRRRELGTGDPAAAPAALPAPPGRPGRRSRTRPAPPACRRPCCTRTRTPVRRHPAPADHAAGAGHRPDPQRAADPAHRDDPDGQPGARATAREMLCLSEQDGDTVLAAIERWQPGGGVRLRGHLGRAGPLRPGRARPGLGAAVVQHRRLRARAAHPPAGRGRLARDRHPRGPQAGAGLALHRRAGLQRDGAQRLPHHPHRPTPTTTAGCIGRPYQFAEVAVLDADGAGAAGRRGRPARLPLADALARATGTTRSPPTGPGSTAGSSPATSCTATRRATTTTWTAARTRSPATAAALHGAVRGADPRRLPGRPRLHGRDRRTEDGRRASPTSCSSWTAGADADVDRTEAVRAALGEQVGATLRRVVAWSARTRSR